ALRSFESQSGSKVTLKVPAETVAGFRTKGISGMMSAEQALRALLGETGLGVKVVGDSTFEIGVQNSEQVDVTTQSTTVALTQFTQPLLDTAQTVNVIPQYIMQEQQVTTLRDTLRNSPGISIAAGEAGAQGDNLTIRGFSARNDMFLDGIRDFGSYYRDAFDYDQVAVLQGPASVQFGRGSTGGVINQETKQPQADQFARGSLQLGTNLMRRVAGDINVPLNDTLNGAAFRMNVVGTQSKVAQRDYAETRRFGIAPSLIFGLNSPTRFSLNYLHEAENSTPDYGLPYFGPRVAQVNRKNYYGFANDNFLRTNPDVVTAKVEHDIGTRATLRNITRWGNYPRNVVITEPQILTAGTLTAIKDSTGKITGYNATCAPISMAGGRQADLSCCCGGEAPSERQRVFRLGYKLQSFRRKPEPQRQ
ncbi:TonB-dependent receptor plug domain-containing protein, partial [Terriglobus sp. YAF25]|uniref:TonB-dependent receptor plug domain-containing protein n=1 Tax=Terriglobus sp. YAF25 TaxID=3233080 RepID=UPI003F98F8C8